jgi:hypothetical protein
VLYIGEYLPDSPDAMPEVNPLISVITPAYRAENTIVRAATKNRPVRPGRPR